MVTVEGGRQRDRRGGEHGTLAVVWGFAADGWRAFSLVSGFTDCDDDLYVIDRPQFHLGAIHSGRRPPEGPGGEDGGVVGLELPSNRHHKTQACGVHSPLVTTPLTTMAISVH